MSTRHPNHRLVKIHRNYTVEEMAQLLGKHKNTVRNWLRDGLEIIDDRRPALVLGSTLVDFLKKRRGRNKLTLKPGEIYCVRCRVAVQPAGRRADSFQCLSHKLTSYLPSCQAVTSRHRTDVATGTASNS